MNMIQSLNSALKLEMERDPNVLILGEDVGKDGGVFRVTEGLLEKFGEKRVIDTPLAESAIIGTSIGLALAGFKPVAEIQFSGFIYPAFDQIISHVSRMRNRSRGSYHCPMVIRTPCSGGVKALEHHSESMEALFVHTPGIHVVMPSSPYDAKGLMASSVENPDPVIFFEPLKAYRAMKEEVPEEYYQIPLGEAKVKREGTDISIVTYGTMVKPSLDAAEELQEKKVSVEVIDLRTLSPLDFDTVLASVKKTGRLVVVHEAPRKCGIGAEIAATVAEKAILELKAPIERITGFDTIIPLFKIENDYIPSKQRIVRSVENAMKF